VTLEELRVIANLPIDDVERAVRALRVVYLFSEPSVIAGESRYSVGSNLKRLIEDEYKNGARGREIATVLRRLGRHTSAHEEEPDVAATCRLVFVKASGGQLRDAETILLAALDAHLDHPRLLAQAGWLYERWRPPRVSEARGSFRRASEMKNRVPNTYSAWIELELDENELEAAVGVAKVALDLCGGSDPKLRQVAGTAYLRLSAASHRRFDEERSRGYAGEAYANFAAAIDAYKRGQVDDEGLSKAYTGAVRSAELGGRLDRAKSRLEEWRTDLPNDPYLIAATAPVARSR
jgi:hypothetical protein